jgi:hypothetical protein
VNMKGFNVKHADSRHKVLGGCVRGQSLIVLFTLCWRALSNISVSKSGISSIRAHDTGKDKGLVKQELE